MKECKIFEMDYVVFKNYAVLLAGFDVQGFLGIAWYSLWTTIDSYHLCHHFVE